MSNQTDIDLAAFSHRIKKIREDEGLSFRAFAEKIGVKASSVEGYEKRGAIPGSDILWKLSRLTGKSMEWILTGKEEQPRAPDITFSVAKTEGGENYSKSGLLELRDATDRLLALRKFRREVEKREEEAAERVARIVQHLASGQPGRLTWTDHLKDLNAVAEKGVNTAARWMAHHGQTEAEPEELKKAS